MSEARRRRVAWDSSSVRALRRHLGLTQAQLADELGTRQQTISEWETGVYRPRGASATLLSIIAERVGFAYQWSAEAEPAPSMGRQTRGEQAGSP